MRIQSKINAYSQKSNQPVSYTGSYEKSRELSKLKKRLESLIASKVSFQKTAAFVGVKAGKDDPGADASLRIMENRISELKNKIAQLSAEAGVENRPRSVFKRTRTNRGW